MIIWKQRTRERAIPWINIGFIIKVLFIYWYLSGRPVMQGLKPVKIHLVCRLIWRYLWKEGTVTGWMVRDIRSRVKIWMKNLKTERKLLQLSRIWFSVQSHLSKMRGVSFSQLQKIAVISKTVINSLIVRLKN